LSAVLPVNNGWFSVLHPFGIGCGLLIPSGYFKPFMPLALYVQSVNAGNIGLPAVIERVAGAGIGQAVFL
jgi:hypothetical protein